MNSKKLLVGVFLSFGIIMLAQAQIAPQVKRLVITPNREINKVALLRYSIEKPGTYILYIRDSQGRLIQVITPPIGAVGEQVLKWDGLDMAGQVVPPGAYPITVSQGLNWTLDKTFGRDGRIGRYTNELAIKDPAQPLPAPEGEIIAVHVNGVPYTFTGNETLAGTFYRLKDGKLILNQAAGLKAGDKVVVEYFYPCLLDNPWCIETDAQGNLYVLLGCKSQGPVDEMTQYRIQGRVVKILPNGQGVDQSFGVNGLIPPFDPSYQAAVSDLDGRLYIAGSLHDSYYDGVYDLKTGAHLFSIGGNTLYRYGLCLIGNGRLVTFGIVFDRSQEGTKGMLYSFSAGVYAPLIDNYWGPCLTAGSASNTFFVANYLSEIRKFMDFGKEAVMVCSLSVGGNPLGMSMAKDRSILFAAPRTASGEVAVILDTGRTLQELPRLRDPELGPVHDVHYRDSLLYVVEDHYPLEKRCATPGVDSRGKNRISRYRVEFGKERSVAEIEVE